jgi:multiple sugar transport system ATP-binding protein
MNFIHGTLTDKGEFISSKGNYKIRIPEEKLTEAREKGYENRDIIFGIRPEDITDKKAVIEAYPDSVVDVTVELSELLGAETNIYTSVDGDAIIASVSARDDLAPGQPLKLAFNMHHCHLFDADTEEIIK